MIERIDSVFYKLRFVIVGLLVIAAAFVLLGVLFAGLQTTSAQAINETAVSDNGASFLDSPNVVSAGILTAANEMATMSHSTVQTVNSGVRSFSATSAKIGRTLGHGMVVGVFGVGKGVGAVFSFTASVTANVTTFIIRIPINIYSSLSSTKVVSSVIKPADYNPVPIIDPNSEALAAAKQALPATPAISPAVPQTNVVAWPIHGIITTEFGVPELPYQAVHTGIDITDQHPSGVTPVKAFRQGKVIATERTGGLGNHVVVDHGNGVTSVYGHLARITVTIGQEVNTTTALGFEGTTGVSTGVHVHFEIRVNGQATNPHQFITGQP